MSNNYLQFSEELRLIFKEKKWFKKYLLSYSEKEERKKDLKNNPFADLYENLNDENFPDFSWALEKNGLWIYSEEQGNVEHATLVVQRFFQVFKHYDRFFTISWAETCSAPRLSEFGGGAVFITHKEISYCPISTWLEKKEKAFIRSLKK